MNLLRERSVTTESILKSALHELHQTESAFPSHILARVQQSIQADLGSRSKQKTLTHIPRDAESALQGVKSSAMLHLVLTKKAALMLATALREHEADGAVGGRSASVNTLATGGGGGAGASSSSSPHRAHSVMKYSVEKIHAKHQREQAWSDQIQRDQQAFFEQQEREKALRVERTQQQRHALDAQIERQREQRHLQQQADAEALQQLMVAEKEQQRLDAEKRKAMLDQQAARRKEADAHAKQQAAQRAASLEQERQNALREAQQLRQADALAKGEAQRRKQEQKKSIRLFVEENERLLAAKRNHCGEPRDVGPSSSPSLLGGTPSSSPPPQQRHQGSTVALPAVHVRGGGSPVEDEAEKQWVRQQQQLRAAEAYTAMVTSHKQALLEREKQSEERYRREQAEKERRDAQLKQKAAQKNAECREALKRQMAEHEESVARERDAEAQLRRELQANVALGDVEDRRVHRIEQRAKSRNLQFIEQQISLQKAMRSAFDVTPKI